MHDRALIGTLITTAHKMKAIDLSRGTSGNLSVRGGHGFFVTPSGIDYDTLTSDDIVDMAFSGEWSVGMARRKPSSEWRIHRDILQRRSEFNAVVHAHPPFATALACLRRNIPAFHYMVAVAGGSDIRCAQYETFGTEELSNAVLVALDGRSACLMANHGIVACGADLEAALNLAIEVETLAEQYWRAVQVGDPVLIDDREMARVVEKFAAGYGYGSSD